jgi:hypothetical protein
MAAGAELDGSKLYFVSEWPLSRGDEALLTALLFLEWQRRQNEVRDMAGAKRDDIRIVGRTTVKEVGDRYEIEWQLSAKPELEWAEIFQLAAPSDRHGPLEWVKGGGPDVMGATVRWFVPSGETENADAEVQHRLSVANQRFGLE